MIFVTSGEPAGIGPDIILKTAVSGFSFPWVVLGDKRLFAERAERLNLAITIRDYVPCTSAPSPKGRGETQEHLQVPSPKKGEHKHNELWIWDIPLKVPVVPGCLDIRNASYVLELLQKAGEKCLHEKGHALVTAPIHKGIIIESGVPFTGHTEYFAELSKTPEVVMLLAADTLRIALATTHLPLKAVPSAITQDKLSRVIQIIHHDLQGKWKINQPHIAVCGLNPHAGEGGHLGREEIEVIIPVLNKMRSEGLHVSGPFPADTVFTQMSHADVILAMYHDQGLPVIKYAAFHEAVNITLGLPFIRTSVDHGTALALAGTDEASESSLVYAVNTAWRILQT